MRRVSFEGVNALYQACLQQIPVVLNSSACDQAMRLREDLNYQLYLQAKSQQKISDPAFYDLEQDFWIKRNHVMADTICKEAQAPSKKIVVITGIDHHYLLNELLAKCSSLSLQSWH